MCKNVDPYISISSRLACTSYIDTKYEKIRGDVQKREKKVQIEGFRNGEISQRSRGLAQTGYQIHGQVIVSEAPKKM